MRKIPGRRDMQCLRRFQNMERTQVEQEVDRDEFSPEKPQCCDVCEEDLSGYARRKLYTEKALL